MIPKSYTIILFIIVISTTPGVLYLYTLLSSKRLRSSLKVQEKLQKHPYNFGAIVFFFCQGTVWIKKFHHPLISRRIFSKQGQTSCHSTEDLKRETTATATLYPEQPKPWLGA